VVEKLCAFYGVSRSGYYAWRYRPENRWVKQNRWLLEKVKEIWHDSRKVYGSPRVLKGLQKVGIHVSKHRVERLMQKNGMTGRVVRVTRRQPGLKRFLVGAPNLLLEAGKPTAPNQQWAGDLTYLKIGRQLRYLAVVLDLYSRRVLAWSLGGKRPTEVTIRILKDAVAKRQPKPGLLFHSDRGIEYRGFNYQKQLKKHGIVPSMNRPRHCTDNAFVESFFHTFKAEFFRGSRFRSTEELRRGIASYINEFYNPKRLHSGLNYLSPEQYEICAI